MFKIGLSY